jgi:hypothetical protein
VTFINREINSLVEKKVPIIMCAKTREGKDLSD